MVALWRYFAEPKGRCTASEPTLSPAGERGEGHFASLKLSTIKNRLAAVIVALCALLITDNPTDPVCCLVDLQLDAQKRSVLR